MKHSTGLATVSREARIWYAWQTATFAIDTKKHINPTVLDAKN